MADLSVELSIGDVGAVVEYVDLAQIEQLAFKSTLEGLKQARNYLIWAQGNLNLAEAEFNKGKDTLALAEAEVDKASKEERSVVGSVLERLGRDLPIETLAVAKVEAEELPGIFVYKLAVS